nr:hypothetical protein [Streptomyces sp. JV178]
MRNPVESLPFLLFTQQKGALAQVERITAGALGESGGCLLAHLDRAGLPHQAPRRRRGQPVQREAKWGATRQAAESLGHVALVGTVGGDQKEGGGAQLLGAQQEQFEAFLVRSVKVVNEEGQGALGGDVPEPGKQSPVQAEALGRVAVRGRPRVEGVRGVDRQHRGEVTGRRGYGGERAEDVEPGPAGRCPVGFRALSYGNQPPLFREVALQVVEQAGLAHPRFTGQQDELPPALTYQGRRGRQFGQLGVPAQEFGGGHWRDPSRIHPSRTLRGRLRGGDLLRRVVGEGRTRGAMQDVHPLLEDGLFQFDESRARVDTQLVAQTVPGPPQRRQGVPLPAVRPQSESQQAPALLAQRLLASEGVGVREGLVQSAAVQAGSGKGFTPGMPQLLQAHALVRRPWFVGELAVGGSGPEVHHRPQPVSHLGVMTWWKREACCQLAFEVPGVHQVLVR